MIFDGFFKVLKTALLQILHHLNQGIETLTKSRKIKAIGCGTGMIENRARARALRAKRAIFYRIGLVPRSAQWEQ